MTTSAIVLSTYCERTEDGSVDVEGTLAKFGVDLLNFVAERDTEDAVIGEAVNALFDKHPGARLVVPYVVSQTLVALNVQPQNSTALTKRVMDFLHANNGERDSGQPYGIGKGKGSGVCRWSTTPEKVVPEKAAKK
jgi:hypothetical protein